MDADKLAENTQNVPQFICSNCLPKPKITPFYWSMNFEWIFWSSTHSITLWHIFSFEKKCHMIEDTEIFLHSILGWLKKVEYALRLIKKIIHRSKGELIFSYSILWIDFVFVSEHISSIESTVLRNKLLMQIVSTDKSHNHVHFINTYLNVPPAGR